jgi:diguanylate cyclase (GGDEF)-like protein
LILDIDHFKHINDTYGHQSGDRVLIQIASRIKEQLRNSDVFARYGGEEFISLLVNTNKIEAEEIAQRIRVSVFENEFLIEHGRTINITISIGVTTVANSGSKLDIAATIKQMLELSDKALYRAKANGRNLVVCMDFLQKGS